MGEQRIPRSPGPGSPEPAVEEPQQADNDHELPSLAPSRPHDGTSSASTRSAASLSLEMVLAVLGVVIAVAALSRSAFLLAIILFISVAIVVAALHYWPHRRAIVAGAAALAVVIASTGVWLLADDGDDPPATVTEAARSGVGVPADPASDGTNVATSEAAPFDVAVTTTANSCGYGFIVPRPPDTIEAPPNVQSTDDEKMAWAERVDGVIAGTGAVTINIQGKTEAQVTLLGIEVRTQRAPPLVGTQVKWVCGGDQAYRWVTVQLDKTPVAIKPEVNPEWIDAVLPHERQPIRFPYRVSLSDAETFLVIPQTDDCDCQWEILLRWASSGRTGVQVIDDGGRPFRTTGTKGATASCIQLGQRVNCGPIR